MNSEAWIDTLRERIAELEAENERLRNAARVADAELEAEVQGSATRLRELRKDRDDWKSIAETNSALIDQLEAKSS